MSAIIKVPEDEQKYEEVMKTIEKLKNYGIQGKDVVVKGNSLYFIPIQGLENDKRVFLEHELYELKGKHGITMVVLDHKADVVKKLVKEGKLFIP